MDLVGIPAPSFGTARTTPSNSVNEARLYPERCDLSPDGQHFIYFALDGRWFGESHGSYTAVSRAPYLKALSFYPRGHTWGGGGLFADNYRFYANEPRDSNAREATQLRRIAEAPDYPRESYFVTRMKRDGWTLIGPPHPYTYSLERPLSHAWSLRCTKVWLTDRYELFNDEQTLPQPDWTWADLDGSRLVYTAQGCLWTAPITKTGLREPHLLHDFNGMKFDPIAAPY